VQNCGINLGFGLFLQRKNDGLSPWAVDRARVAGPWVHRGPHSGRRPELGLAVALGQDDLPRRHGRQTGDAGTLVAGSPQTEGQ
jgi:hypothetical protein